MKSLFAAAAAAALLAGAATASAQAYPAPVLVPVFLNPPVAPPSLPAPGFAPTEQLEGEALPPWMQDDGSSSDYPIHNPGDVSGDRLNAQYQGGLTTAPGTGLPAEWGRP